MVDMSKKAIAIATLKVWAMEELKNGNRTKASKVNRVMEKMRHSKG